MAERAVNTDSRAQRLLVLQRSSIQLGEDKQEACINLPIVLRCREHGGNHVAILTCSVLSGVGLFVTPRTVAHQAPLSMEFSKQEYWKGLPLPSPGDLPHPGIKLESPAVP